MVKEAFKCVLPVLFLTGSLASRVCFDRLTVMLAVVYLRCCAPIVGRAVSPSKQSVQQGYEGVQLVEGPGGWQAAIRSTWRCVLQDGKDP